MIHAILYGWRHLVRLSNLHNETVRKCALAYGCLVNIHQLYACAYIVYAIIHAQTYG